MRFLVSGLAILHLTVEAEGLLPGHRFGKASLPERRVLGSGGLIVESRTSAARVHAWCSGGEIDGIPVCSLDDIIASKRAANRPRDRESLPRQMAASWLSDSARRAETVKLR